MEKYIEDIDIRIIIKIFDYRFDSGKRGYKDSFSKIIFINTHYVYHWNRSITIVTVSR